MSYDFHTPYQNSVTNYSAASMNVPLGQLDYQLQQLSTSIYDIGGSFENIPTGSETILRFPLPRAVTFPAGMTNSQMISEIAATAEAVFSIRKNGIEFATATFAAGSFSATFSGNETSFIQSDILTLVAPIIADSTIENLGWALVGSRTVLTSI